MIRTRQALYPGFVMSFLIEFQRLIWKNLTICVIALHVFISYMYLCRTIYNVTFQNDDENITYKVEVSYIEIYNEKVRDLLCPRGYVTNISFQVFLNPMCSYIIFAFHAFPFTALRICAWNPPHWSIIWFTLIYLEIMLPWESVNTRF